MGVIFTLLARKGGVGKTTLALNLAGLLSAEGLTVRLVDLDAQASLTQFWLGPEATEELRPRETVEAVFRGDKPEDVERETRLPGVSLLPSVSKLKVEPGAELNLDRTPAVTILDTPPDIYNPVVRAALVATDFVVSPVTPEPFGLQSIPAVQALVAGSGLSSNPNLVLMGYVVSLRQRLSVHKAIGGLLRRIHGDKVFDAEIPSLCGFKESLVAGKTIFEHERKGKAAAAVRAFWDEAIERVAKETNRRQAA